MNGERAKFASLALAVLVLGSVVAATATVPGIAAASNHADPSDGSGPGSGVQTERGQPGISVHLPDEEVKRGEVNEVPVQIRNDGEVVAGSGERVTTARSVVVAMRNDGPFDARTEDVAVGPVQDGGLGEARYPIVVPDDVEPGEHDVRFHVSYTYASQVRSDGTVVRDRTTEFHRATIVVPEGPQFDVTNVTTDVAPGADGDATIDVENAGAADATDVRATIAGGGGVVVDGGAAEVVLGDVEEGESVTTTVNVGIDAAASATKKPLDVEFTYADEDGVRQESVTEMATLDPASEQSFAVRDLEADLAVGHDGEVTGEVFNDGPRTVDDAVLVVEPVSESLFVEDARYALPELSANESAPFRYPVDVSGQADGGDRQLRFTVEYAGGDGTPLEDGPHPERVAVDDRADEFSIESVNATVQAGETADLVLEITNERSIALSNVDAMLYTDTGLSANNDRAFVDELEPGESAELRFDVTAASDAFVETHPVELDFEYDTERGTTTLSDTYQHPVTVTAAREEGGSGIGIVGTVGLIAVVGGAVAIWRRRR